MQVLASAGGDHTVDATGRYLGAPVEIGHGYNLEFLVINVINICGVAVS
jgi:hypothetical protein